MNPAPPSPIARALRAALTDDTSDAGRAELTRLVEAGADINAAIIVSFGPEGGLHITTPLSCVLLSLIADEELDDESLAVLDHLLSPPSGRGADVARPWRYGPPGPRWAGAWLYSPLFGMLMCWKFSSVSLPLEDAVRAIVPRLLARDAPLFLRPAAQQAVPEADDDDFHADCLEELLRGLEPFECLPRFVHDLAHTPAAVRARADIVRYERGTLMRAWLRLRAAEGPFRSHLGGTERMLDDLLRLGVAFDPSALAASPRLRQAAEANEHRGLRTIALASALARYKLPLEVQHAIAAHANASGTYELRVGRPDAAHQLRAYTHWAHRTRPLGAAPRPPTHLLTHTATAP